MFSSTAEYALRAVVHLATSPDQRENSQTIAAATKVPPGYLSKILKDLAEAGIVLSQRGPTGGFTLARPPSEITVLDVINAVDPIKRIRVCPLGNPAHGANLCRLHRKLDDAIAGIEKAFATSTIAEMLEPARPSRSCAFPVATAPQPVRVNRPRNSSR